MDKKYLELLASQYEQATGEVVKCSDKVVFSNDFYDWITERNNDGLKYLDMLKSLRIDYDENLLEIGKGKLDTLVKKDYGSIILTPYIESFSEKDKRRIIYGDLFVGKDSDTGVIHSKISSSRVSFNDFNKIATHNPYDLNSIINWEKLFDRNDQIILGMFGKKEEIDFDKKIQVLEEIKRNLLDSQYLEKYETVGSTYLYTIIGNKSKKKVR